MSERKLESVESAAREPNEEDVWERQVTAEAESALNALIHQHAVRLQPPAAPGENLLVGEVIDTHHPHRPGRVLVRWLDRENEAHEHWLSRVGVTQPRIGTRVLLSMPSNWPEWLVVGSLAPAPAEVRPASSSTGRVIRLDSGEAVRVEAADGRALFELTQRDGEPVLRLERDLTLEVEGKFAVNADRIELTSGQGGTDSRSAGEMVLRSPRVRIN